MTLSSSLEALARETSKQLNTLDEALAFSQQLKQYAIESALGAEIDDHLGYRKHDVSSIENSRNGYSHKQVKTADGPMSIATPRDREGTFEPKLIKKRQTRFTSLDERILYLYAKGMTTREIAAMLKDLYEAEVSPQLISRVTAAVTEQVQQWQARPLEAIYPIVYLDCIVVKIRENSHVINKAIYVALGVNLEGQKEVLGLWLSKNEGAKFWLQVLTELNNRGIKDILIACVDGLKGFPEAITSVFPKTQVQLCIVHQVRNSMRYVVYKDYKAVTTDLKCIYQAPTEEAALAELTAFAKTWDGKYPSISRSWQANWGHLNTFFHYPTDIRRAIYTTNAIESLNSVIRKAVKKRQLFPSDDAALKVIYLAIQEASKKWSMPIRHWKPALNHFMILFEERISPLL